MAKYYLDTSIWRDYFENRQDKFRPLGDWAFELLRQIKERKDIVLYSKLVVNELSSEYSSEEINKMFDIVKKRLVEVCITNSQRKEAGNLSRKRNLPFGDCLHAILSRDNNAISITRDKHFVELNDITESYKPEDLI